MFFRLGAAVDVSWTLGSVAFLHLTTSSVYRSAIPDELVGHISRGEFGGGIASLYLGYPRCEPSTIIYFFTPRLERVRPHVQRDDLRPTVGNFVCRATKKTIGAVGSIPWCKCCFGSPRSISSHISSIHHDQLLAPSSETLAPLILEDSWFPHVLKL